MSGTVKELIAQGAQNTLHNTHSALTGKFWASSDGNVIDLGIQGITVYRSFVPFGDGALKVKTYLDDIVVFNPGELISGVPFPLVIKEIIWADTTYTRILILP